MTVALTEAPRTTGRLRRWLTTLAVLTVLVAIGAAVALNRLDRPLPTSDDWLVRLGVGAILVALVLALAVVVVEARERRRLVAGTTTLERVLRRKVEGQVVAGRLARALSLDDAVDALATDLPAAIGAQAAVVAMLDDHGRLEAVSLSVARATEPVAPVVPDSVVGTVLATGQAAWLPSPLGWRGDVAADDLARGGMAMALLPIVDREVRGVLAVSYKQVHQFVADEKEELETIAVLASRAISRGRRYDQEHRAALAFQRSALPSAVPTVAGLTIAALYRPGSQSAAVGGDWYDVVVLPDGRVLFVVGDVVGHGMVAAAAMGRLRTAFQTVATYFVDAGAMVAAVGRQAASIPDAFCTTVVSAIVDPVARTVSWCRAGHPPALLLDGTGRFLSEGGNPPLGVVDDPNVTVHHRQLSVGDRLVFYTDGLVERRGEGLVDGLERLKIVATDLVDLAPSEQIQALVEALTPTGEQADDIVVLVVQVD